MPSKETAALPGSADEETVVEPTNDTRVADSPIPNVQAEANPGSNAPEDVRDGAVAEPNT